MGEGSRPVRADGMSWIVEEHIDPANCTPDLFGPGWTPETPHDGGGELGRERQLFFDLETTGWIDRAQIFMAGYLFWVGGQLKLVQEIAADVAEERFLVISARQRIVENPHVISFNGASYDLPLLRRRLKFHGLPDLPEEMEHTDLLHRARRRYRRQLRDCRLSTLETEILGKRRLGLDVPGSEAPMRYYDYSRTGRREYLEPILYHNRVDLTSLVLLHERLQEPVAESTEPEEPSVSPSPVPTSAGVTELQDDDL